MPWLRSTVAILLLAAVGLAQQALAPRTPLPKRPIVARPLVEVVPDVAPEIAALSELRLIVKFADELRVRATPAGDVVSRTGRDLAAVRAAAAEHAMTFGTLVHTPETRLDALAARAAARTGRAQPDLAGILAVGLPDTAPATLERAGAALDALPEVEFAYVQTLGVPPPGDIAPPTPDLSGNQGYAGADPGLNAEYAKSIGIDGSGIRVADCEYGWNPDHEDLVDIDLNLEPGQTIAQGVFDAGWDSHGTAVLGEMSAVDNGYGCTGLAPGAEVFTYPEWTVQQGFRRVTAITNAIADSDVGDVVLLEMQTTGVSGYAPAEYDPAVFLAVKTGTDAGVVVVAAAGNGNQDLDSAGYASYMAMGDSGAIIVGAGSSTTAHNKLSFSTYGTRVDVQGWGENVFTLGYGWFATYGGDKNQRYTQGFSGTSSASPFVAAACCLLQQYSLSVEGQPLSPTGMRELLIATGVPQGSGGEIGPFVDVETAILDFVFDGLPWIDLGNGLPGFLTITPVYQIDGLLIGGTTVDHNLQDARPLRPATFVIGASAIDAPFKGGVMVPSTDLLLAGFATDFLGNVNFSTPIPASLPSGGSLYFQWWISDPDGPAGFSASNAWQGNIP